MKKRTRKEQERFEIGMGLLYHFVALLIGFVLVGVSLWLVMDFDKSISLIEEDEPWTYLSEDQITGLAIAQAEEPHRPFPIEWLAHITSLLLITITAVIGRKRLLKPKRRG